MIEVIGIGAGGWVSLAEPERHLVQEAQLVLGGQRLLDLLPQFPGQARVTWPSNLRAALPQLVRGHDDKRVVVVASGDPLLYGVGSTLIELFGVESVRIHPTLSSVSLAAARMGWPVASYDVVRIRTPEADEIRRYLAPGCRLVILSRDGSTPGIVGRLLREAGFGHSTLTVLAEVGSPGEARWDDSWPTDLPPLHVLCVTCRPDRLSSAWSIAPGLTDDTFDHDGQLTKQDVRASALAHLRPVPGQLLWDVGAGAGSIGIEWARTHPSCRTMAVERDLARAKRIRLNAARLGVGDLEVVEGEAPGVLCGLPAPDAVFVGGGASTEVIDFSWTALAPGGRLVAHAVTLQTETVLVDAWRRLGGQLTRMSVETMQPIGSYDGWRPSRPVVQWAVQKALAGQ
ncbi:MAG TPA: precorrin-6y C5,15-methyltransferase (decarboxylating) subunit CbiE [Propionibacteriaceae bacterium]|nr:precorrin-6y C5,15-methyltransferase (decarboxylating) subunit CbiE [Propionibacteriaceae bacterium]